MIRPDVDAVVVGAGVIGLAVARRLAHAGMSVVITEREVEVGSATSARNSEVIHAGLYYGGTPLKRQYCVTGRSALYDYCARRRVRHRRLGKLIAAFSDADLPTLENIRTGAMEAGIDDISLISAGAARALEPALSCHAALLSPSTGIIDSHGFMMALLADAETDGALLARRTLVSRLSHLAGGLWGVHIDGSTPHAVVARRVVIAAGHGAHLLAAATEGIPRAAIPPQYYARGHYFMYHGQHPFSRLIYPVPVPGGLGTHLTLDLHDRARFGPDVEWIDGVDYQFGGDRHQLFVEAARRIWPELDPSRLLPDYCGVRPKLHAAGEPAADFAIHGRQHHGQVGLVVLYGIESPGLTASLAIADAVAHEFDCDS